MHFKSTLITFILIDSGETQPEGEFQLTVFHFKFKGYL